MSPAPTRFIDRLLHQLPSWVFLLAGMGMLASACIVPHWLENRHLFWQVQVMRTQAQSMQEQEQDYRDFHRALVDNDPVLLERLAFHQLRLKPSGAATLVRSAVGSESFGRVTPTSLAIESWLRRPLPGSGIAPPPPPRSIGSRLIRMSTGRARVPFMIAGMAAVVIGLVLPIGPAEKKAAPPKDHFAPTDLEDGPVIVAEDDL